MVGWYVRMIGLRAGMMSAWIVAGFDLSNNPASRWCAVPGIGPSFAEELLEVETLENPSAVSVSPEPRWCMVLSLV